MMYITNTNFMYTSTTHAVSTPYIQTFTHTCTQAYFVEVRVLTMRPDYGCDAMHTCIHTSAHSKCIHIYTYVHADILYGCRRINSCPCMHPYISTYLHSCLCHTSIHLPTHPYMHAYIHTYILLWQLECYPESGYGWDAILGEVYIHTYIRYG
jgi:hypothetical protein